MRNEYNLAYEKEYLNLINDFRNEIPQNPISLPEESLMNFRSIIFLLLYQENFISVIKKGMAKRFENKHEIK